MQDEHKQAQQTLKEDEKLYRDLVENVNDLIQSVTPDGSFIYVNRAWRETLGYTEEEIQNLSLFDIVHPDNLTHCREIFQRVTAGEKVERINARFLARDGRAILVEGSVNCRIEDGKPVATRGIFRDITERRHVEDALRASEKKFKQFFENEPGYCYMVSPDGVILDVNRAALQALGYQKEELRGKPLKTIYAPEELPKMEGLFAKWKETGRLEDEEIVIITKGGERRVVLLSASALKDENGRVLQSVSVQKDITNRKQAEDALRESEEILSACMNAATDAITLLDAELNIISVNKAALEIIGTDEKNPRGVNLLNLVPDLKKTGRYDKYMEVIRTGKPFFADDFVTHPEFGDLHLAVKVFKVGDGLGIMASDITDLKLGEEMLREANQELQRFAAVDGLTLVANRRQFDTHLAREWEKMSHEQKPFSLIMGDLDWFKAYNDTYGHLSGDDCLRAVAKTISTNLGHPGSLVARYGGEEFVVVLPDTNTEEAVRVAEFIRTEIEQLEIPHAQSTASQYLTVSLGVSSVASCQGIPPKAIIEVADKALYEAKKQGRNRVVFKPLTA